MEIRDKDQISPKRVNTTVMAFIGDAVYEVYARDYAIRQDSVHADKLHKLAVKYVRAESQAKAVKSIYDELDEDEKSLVKRARNRKITSKPRSMDPLTYKWATALEALVGYLHTAGKTERLEELIQKMFAAIENED